MKKRELWLFSKHGNDTGDNAFVFFKYIRRTHPEIRCVYVADKRCANEYREAQEAGEVVQFRSLRHKLLFLAADKIITSHVGDSEPWDYEKVIEWRQKHPRFRLSCDTGYTVGSKPAWYLIKILSQNKQTGL